MTYAWVIPVPSAMRQMLCKSSGTYPHEYFYETGTCEGRCYTERCLHLESPWIVPNCFPKQVHLITGLQIVCESGQAPTPLPTNVDEALWLLTGWCTRHFFSFFYKHPLAFSWKFTFHSEIFIWIPLKMSSLYFFAHFVELLIPCLNIKGLLHISIQYVCASVAEKLKTFWYCLLIKGMRVLFAKGSENKSYCIFIDNFLVVTLFGG